MSRSLTRRYDLPVAVEQRDGQPLAFTRQGRRYQVRAVLAHWWESGAWWDSERPLGDEECELWRVEAAVAGLPVAVVDLCLSWSTGDWTVAAVDD